LRQIAPRWQNFSAISAPTDFMINLHGMHGPGVVAIVCAFAGLVAWAVAFIWEDDL